MALDPISAILLFFSQLNPAIFWLAVGFILCVMELVLPTAFVEFLPGVSALIVAGLSLFIPYFFIQVVLWVGLSAAFIVLSRRFLSKQKVPQSLAEAQEAQTLTAIPPGEAGRVIYDGNSWRAKCSDPEEAIAPHQPVFVVGRQGNTLIVIPEHLLQS
jgi:membrane protein implicated in regulation of membrane protease activity